MPTNTYTPIASVTLSATASGVVFSGLPQTFRDLVIVFDGASPNGSAQFFYNNDSTAANYKQVRMYNFNGSVASDTLDNNFFNLGNLATKQVSIIQIFDYSQTNKHKTALIRHNTPATAVGASATRWTNTAAITSVGLFHETATFSSGSSFTLFGVIA